MLELMKIVGLSAALSAGIVTASDMPGRPDGGDVSGGKIYTDRLPSDDGSAGSAEAVSERAGRITYAAGRSLDDEGPQRTSGAKGDLLRQGPQAACGGQAWPNIPPDCLGAADGTPLRGRVRLITVEHREGANTSVLVRLPAPEVAQR